jgi:hypothetical protein
MLPWLVLLFLLIALAAAAFYVWQTRYNVPNLFYTLLPSYEIPDVITVSALLVENRGRVGAPNIKIVIQFDGDDAPMIHHMQVASTEGAVTQNGGERHTFAQIEARLIRPHGRIVVYWAAGRDVQPRVHVTSTTVTPDPSPGNNPPHHTDA